MKIKEKKLSIKEKLHRGHFLYFLYCYIYTRVIDWKIAKTSMDGLFCNEGVEIFPVQSVNYRILREMRKEIKIDPEDVFVDVGCGLGRLLGFLRLYGIKGKKSYGIEINKRASQFAMKVFENSDDVTIIYGDATITQIEDATVYFLFNPFGENVLNAFLDNLERTAKKGTRIYYLNAVFERVFYQRKKTWLQVSRFEMKPKYHIPIVLCEYRFTGGTE